MIGLIALGALAALVLLFIFLPVVAWSILGLIVLIIVLVLIVPIGADVSYIDGELRLAARANGFSFQLLPKKPGDEDKPQKEKKPVKPKKEKKPKPKPEAGPKPKKKLDFTMDEILELREEIRENISFLDACALDITLLDKEEKQLAAQLQEVLSALLPQRREAAADFARQLEEELRQLGFSEQVRVIPDFMPQEVWPGLMDEKVRILWAPNPGQAPQPLDRIASGGELSRFLLALMSVRPKAESATYIFDEVDAGVGGLTLNKLAEKLENLAKQRQMLVITHWPQLAARAQKHFQISKTIRDNATFTTCVPLDARQRHAELVRMAGGGQQGEALAASLEGRSYQLTMF